MINISVLMSTHIKENPAYLDSALESIYSQSLKPYELVLVQDGPITFAQEHIISKWVKTGLLSVNIVRLKSNVGLATALNKGLMHCRSSWIARMDSDDISFKERLMKQKRFIEKNNVNILGSWALRIDKDGKKNGILKVPVFHKDIKRLIWASPFIHPTVMYEKDKILSLGGYDPSAGKRQEDYDLWFRAALTNMKFGNIPEPLLYYRFTEDSAKKYDIRVGWDRLKIGVKGCWTIKAPFYAYFGVAYPLVRSLMPYPLNYWIHEYIGSINPKQKF